MNRCQCRVERWSESWLEEVERIGEVDELQRFERWVLSDADTLSKFIDDDVEFYKTQQHVLYTTLIQQLIRIKTELRSKVDLVLRRIAELRNNLQPNGLTPARIQQFHKCLADESLVGDRCSICQDDIEVGRKMMRLDCNGQHVFCQDCVEGWFADHKTCPNCRHAFA